MVVILDLPVEDGMPVKKGDLLIKIKPDSYRALVEAQEAAISGARAVNLQEGVERVIQLLRGVKR